MSEPKKSKKEIIDEVFSYLEDNSIKCREYSDKLEKSLEKEEIDPEEIMDYSSLSSFYFHLLENNLDFNIAYTWFCFFDEGDQDYLEKKLEKTYNTFSELGEKINKISDKMIDYRKKVSKEQGEEEVNRITENGFITPLEFLNVRDEIEERGLEEINKYIKKIKKDENDIMYM